MSNHFSKVPHWVLALVVDGSLPPGAIVTYAAVAKYVNHRTGRGAWPSNRTLRADTGFSERTVRDHLSALESCGAIVRQARHSDRGRQTSNMLLVVTEEPPAAPGESSPPPAASPATSPPTSLATTGETGSQSPPPPGSQSPPYELDPVTNQSVSPSPSDDAASTRSPDPVLKVPVQGGSSRPEIRDTIPLAQQRQLQNMGVTDGAIWTQAWQAAVALEWPPFAAMEANQFPSEHLTLHLMSQQDQGRTPSASRWLRFYIEDRARRIAIIAGQLEQEARMSETPQEREDRLNRRLPPLRNENICTCGALPDTEPHRDFCRHATHEETPA